MNFHFKIMSLLLVSSLIISLEPSVIYVLYLCYTCTRIKQKNNIVQIKTFKRHLWMNQMLKPKWEKGHFQSVFTYRRYPIVDIGSSFYKKSCQVEVPWSRSCFLRIQTTEAHIQGSSLVTTWRTIDGKI